MTGKREQAKAIVLSALMVLSVIAIGSAGFAGSAAADEKGDIEVTIGGADTSNVSAGQNADIGDIYVTDRRDGGGLIDGNLVLDMPSGVSINQSQSSVGVYGNASDKVNESSLTVGSQTIEIEVESGFDENERLELTGVETDIAADADASFAGTESQLTLETRNGNVDRDISGFNISKPALRDNGEYDVAAGANGEPVTFHVNTTSFVDGQIGNNTNIVLSSPSSSGVTFDTSVDPAELTSDGSDLVDNSSANISDNQVEIPTTSEFSGGENLTIDGLSVNATPSASNTNLTATVEPTQSVGTVSVENDQSSGGAIQIDKPTVSVSPFNASVGALNQSVPSELNVSEPADVNGIGEDTNVTLKLNDDDVTFSKLASPNATAYNTTAGTANGTAPVQVNDDSLSVNVSELGWSDDGNWTVGFNASEVALNVTSAPSNDTVVGFQADTQSAVNDQVVTSDLNESLTLNTPTAQFNEETTISTDDADGANEEHVGTFNVSQGPANSLAKGQNITITLGNGVTFDANESQGPFNASIDNGSTGSFDSTLGAGAVQVNTDSITVNVTADVQANSIVAFENLSVNATSSATNVTPTVDTNTDDVTTAAGGNDVTVDSQNQIIVSGASPSKIKADANVSDGTGFGSFGGDVSDDGSPQVDETINSEVYVEDGDPGGFGGADVDLAIASTPDGSSGASLSDSTITTDSSGNATFNFTTGNTTGDYVVTATLAGQNLSSDAGVNITYDAQSGDIDGVSVEPIENAVAGASGNTSDAALYVNATDQFGNPASGSDDVDVTLSGGDNATAYENWSGQTGEDNADNLNDGTFSIDAADGSSVIVVESNSVEDVTVDADLNGNTDSGTVTFFDTPSQIDLSLNQTDTVRNAVVEASATVSDSSGTTVEVPDIEVRMNEQGTSNTSLDDQTYETDGSGVATTTFTADSEGSADIRGKLNIRDTDTETLTINAPSLSVDSNVSSVTPNTETDVQSTVTYANNGSVVEGATVNVTGAGVSVDEQDTDDDGNVSYSVNASSAGTITVEATKDNTNAGQDTISVGSLGDLDVSLSPDSVVANQSEDVTVSVTNASSGDSVEGATAAISGQDSNTTDANGEAVLSVNASSTDDLTVDVSATGFNDTQETLTVTSDSVPPDAVYNDPNSVPAQYDSDGDGKITRGEVTGGVNAYFDGTIERSDVTELVNAYFDSQ